MVGKVKVEWPPEMPYRDPISVDAILGTRHPPKKQERDLRFYPLMQAYPRWHDVFDRLPPIKDQKA